MGSCFRQVYFWYHSLTLDSHLALVVDMLWVKPKLKPQRPCAISILLLNFIAARCIGLTWRFESPGHVFFGLLVQGITIFKLLKPKSIGKGFVSAILAKAHQGNSNYMPAHQPMSVSSRINCTTNSAIKKENSAFLRFLVMRNKACRDFT